MGPLHYPEKGSTSNDIGASRISPAWFERRQWCPVPVSLQRVITAFEGPRCTVFKSSPG